MPELPEVEQFRQFLLPLISPTTDNNGVLLPLTVELINEANRPRKWLSAEDVQSISGKFGCTHVLRKGKQLCMVLEEINNAKPIHKSSTPLYLYLHMGMTGRLTTPGGTIRFAEGVNDDGKAFPPPYTYLLLSLPATNYQVAFADPRKFGSALLHPDTRVLDTLAPDALDTLVMVASSSTAQQQLPTAHEDLIACNSGGFHHVLPKLCNQSIGIKPLLMDQKRAVSGVGNWVADEVLYQTQLHPDQTHLTYSQSETLLGKLRDILVTAVQHLRNDEEFPQSWLFHHRWTKKKAGSKDALGRSLSFITSGGRTSAIVASVQKLTKQRRVKMESETMKARNIIDESVETAHTVYDSYGDNDAVEKINAFIQSEPIKIISNDNIPQRRKRVATTESADDLKPRRRSSRLR